jgi:hypothetical protein
MAANDEQVLRIDMYVQSLMNCTCPGRSGLEGIYLDSAKGAFQASDGHILAKITVSMDTVKNLPNLLFRVTGPNGKKGKRLTKDETIEVHFDAVVEHGAPSSDFDGIVYPTFPIGPDGEFRENKPYEIHFYDPKYFPETDPVVSSALGNSAGNTVGINLELLKKLQSVLGDTVVLHFPTGEGFDPIVVKANNRSADPSVVSREVCVPEEDDLGLLMPMRVD